MAIDFPLPRRCSLLQAALWVARKEQPIADDAFSAAPLKLDPREMEPGGPLRSLLQALYTGAVSAWGNVVLWGRDDSSDSTYTRRKVAYEVRLPPSCWSWDNVEWMHSRIVGLRHLWLFFVDYSLIEDDTSKIDELSDAYDDLREIITSIK
jgi:hypothetical protein